MKKIIKRLSALVGCLVFGWPTLALADAETITANGSVGRLNDAVTAQGLTGQAYCQVSVDPGLVATLSFMYTDGAGHVSPDPLANSSTLVVSGKVSELVAVPFVAAAFTAKATSYTSGSANAHLRCSGSPDLPNIVPPALSTAPAGSLFYAPSANTVGSLSIGSSGKVLTVASGQPVWAMPAGVSPLVSPLVYAGGLGPMTNTPPSGNDFFVMPAAGILGHLRVTCQVYNPTDAAVLGQSNYTSLNSAGLGGGTVTIGITNGTYSVLTPLVLGSVVMPTSPQAGPWVTSVTATVGTPYAVLPNDNLTWSISAVDGSAAQWDYGCLLYVGA
jgi:hypothetical protein